MGILDNIAPKSAAQQGGASQGRRITQQGSQDRPQAKLWLNVGYTTEDGQFVSLPVGIPIDTMEPVSTRGKEDWAKFQFAKNALLAKLQGAAMEPGEARMLNLEVQLRRVNEDVQVSAEDNPYTANLDNLFI